MRRRHRSLGVWIAAAGLAISTAAPAQPFPLRSEAPAGAAVQIRVLSSRSDLVTGGDALVEIRAPGAARLSVNGKPATADLRTAGPGVRVGLLSGLKLGRNVLEVGTGKTAAKLTVTNWPRQGPVISGPHETPFVCMTESFELPVTGGVLGPSSGPDCEARTRVDYVYRRTGGEFAPLPPGASPADADQVVDVSGVKRPYVVRIETGVVDRSIYQIAMLHDPRSPAPAPTAPSASWNRGLVFTFGGGCPGGMYIQGKTTGGVLEDEMLRRGYAVASSSLNVYGNNCHDLLATEAMMMVKERFIELFGLPKWTIGWGCSGGSYQAEQIADNYPGLLDGIVVGCSFPDVGHAAVSVHSFGAKLVYNYYVKGAKTPWTEAEIVAASGLPDLVSLRVQGDRGDRTDPQGVCSPAIPKALLYDPVKNPKGARCSIYDHGKVAFGIDPATGFARRPLDNVGVQYGLVAFKAGKISKAQFLDINRNIGGVDIDARFIPTRTVGDLQAIRQGYRTGRFLSGGGGLAATPIIDYRAYADFNKGDPHQRFHSFSFRERLIAANGHADNQVLLTESDRYGLFSLKSPVLQEALDQMGAWIRTIQADASNRAPAVKVVAAKPKGLVDACWTREGSKIVERQVWGQDTACNRLYPPHANPFIAAGAPLASNVVKCALKPLDRADYPVAFTDAEWRDLQTIFPTGVCDYTKPGVEQLPLIGTWLSFGPAPLSRIPGHAHP